MLIYTKSLLLLLLGGARGMAPPNFSSPAGSLPTEHRACFQIFVTDKAYKVELPNPKGAVSMSMFRMGVARRRASEAILAENCQHLVDCGFHTSPMATRKELITTHDRSYVDKILEQGVPPAIFSEKRNIAGDLKHDGVDRVRACVGGTLAATRAVLSELRRRIQAGTGSSAPVWGGHFGGGTHHAQRNFGSRYCCFNDLAVAANIALQEYQDLVKKILILDLDVHPGDGTAIMFHGRTDVITASLHCAGNTAMAQEGFQSDFDREIKRNCNDREYRQALCALLKNITKIYPQFDLILFQSGVDIYKGDRFGRADVSLEGITDRNRIVFDYANGTDTPLVITLGGGYPGSDETFDDIVAATAGVYVQAHSYLKNEVNRRNRHGKTRNQKEEIFE